MATYNNVLKITKNMTTKNPRARSACWERLKERYITSIVLRTIKKLGMSLPVFIGRDVKEGRTGGSCCCSGMV